MGSMYFSQGQINKVLDDVLYIKYVHVIDQLKIFFFFTVTY